MDTGSTESRVVWADSPTPYDILTQDDDFGFLIKPTLASLSNNLIKKRKGYLNLAPGDTTKDAIRSELFFELNEPEIVFRNKGREKAKFHSDNRVQNPDWLNSEPFDIPLDADSIYITYSFSANNISESVRSQINGNEFLIQLSFQNESKPGKSVPIKNVSLSDLNSSGFYLVKEMVKIPVKKMRGDRARLEAKLLGKDKGVIPAYTEVYYYPADDDSLNKEANRYAIRDLTDQIIPENYALRQNYPNPFNPETRIEFALPEAGRTRLIIYDVLGREVTRLVDSNLSAGYHNVIWNASNVASGIYFYRLAAGDFVSTKKMVLLR